MVKINGVPAPKDQNWRELTGNEIVTFDGEDRYQVRALAITPGTKEADAEGHRTRKDGLVDVLYQRFTALGRVGQVDSTSKVPFEAFGDKSFPANLRSISFIASTQIVEDLDENTNPTGTQTVKPTWSFSGLMTKQQFQTDVLEDKTFETKLFAIEQEQESKRLTNLERLAKLENAKKAPEPAAA